MLVLNCCFGLNLYVTDGTISFRFYVNRGKGL